jgi:hypothetical protein
MDNILTSLMSALEKDLTDNYFKVSLKDWIIKNKNGFYQQIINVFNKHKRSDPNKWNYADFKRWVLTG